VLPAVVFLFIGAPCCRALVLLQPCTRNDTLVNIINRQHATLHVQMAHTYFFS